MFENVTYTYYSDTLGRAVIPNESEFNALKLENIQFIKRILPFIAERETNGIDNAVCLCMEVDYTEAQAKNGNAKGAVSSESVSGHSVSYETTQTAKESELNAKSTDEKKMSKIKLFCDVSTGV